MLPEDSSGIHGMGDRVHGLEKTRREMLKCAFLPLVPAFVPLPRSRRDTRRPKGNKNQGEWQQTWCCTKRNQLRDKAKQRGCRNKGLLSNQGLGSKEGRGQSRS